VSSPVPFDDALAKLQAANLGYTIALPNEQFDVPEPPAPWLSVSATSTMLAPADLGANVWQEEGTFYIDVMVPSGSGTSTARTLAKDVANVFRGLGPENVVYLSTAIGSGSVGTDDGLWFCITVSVDWRYQDVLA
jgi:hypothetical protein